MVVMKEMIYCKEIEEYIQYVKEYPNETDDEIKLLIENIVKPTLSRDDVFFDVETYYKAIRFCERWFYKLFPYQKFLYAFFFMYDKTDPDSVLFSEIFILMGRGNGKDGMIAPLACFLLTHYYGVNNYHIDIVATSEDQANDTFLVVYNMLEANKKIMRKYFYWNKEVIINKKTHSRLRYNTSGAKTKDGKQTGMVIFNEVHAYEDEKEINVFTSGLGKVKHARIVTITTNGTVRDGPLDEKIDLSNRMLHGEYNFTRIFPVIYKINDKNLVDEPMKKFLETKDRNDIDITFWIQANPSLKYRNVLKNQIIADYLKMMETPSYRTEFYAKRMNLPEQDEDEAAISWNYIEKASWIDKDKKIAREATELENRDCIIGIDFADLNDFASAGLLFKLDNGEYVWRCKTWICANGKDYKNIKFPFDRLGTSGFMDFTIVYTNTISGKELVDWCIEQITIFNVKKIVMDTYRAKLLKKYFDEYGITIEDKLNKSGLVRMIRYPASIAAIVAPDVEQLFAEGLVNIGNSAIMRWAINNTATKMQSDGNKKYIKINPKLRKNDPFMAFIAAISVKELLEEQIIYV